MDRINLNIGELSTVTLQSRGSAGYRWHFTLDNPLLVDVTRLLSSQGGDEQFSVLGKAIGETAIHFSQSRSFGEPKPPLAIYDLLVVIKEQV